MGDKAAARAAAAAAGVPVVPGSDGAVADVEAAVAAAASSTRWRSRPRRAAAGAGSGSLPTRRRCARRSRRRRARRAARSGTSGSTSSASSSARATSRSRSSATSRWASASARCSGGARRSSRRRRRRPTTRPRCATAAAALAGSIGYRGAGTLEFLVDDATGEYFFIEMNTRIQVEHPVTELVCGVDLVAAQLTGRAAGVRAPRGCALELRLNAEDPAKKFMPSPGVGVRRDAGPPGRGCAWTRGSSRASRSRRSTTRCWRS